MNIDSEPGKNLCAALIVALNLADSGTAGTGGASPAPIIVETAAAITGVLWRFAEVIAEVAFPAIPGIEGFAEHADDTPALILAELRGLRADLADRAFINTPIQIDAKPIVEDTKLPKWMGEIAADSLCAHVASEGAGTTLADTGEQLTNALVALSARISPG